MDDAYKSTRVGVVGGGTMGFGIALLAASHGHRVFIYDSSERIVKEFSERLRGKLQSHVKAGKLDQKRADGIFERIVPTDTLDNFGVCNFVIESIVENTEMKKSVFSKLRNYIPETAIIATNTSALSVTEITTASKIPDRCLGVHFFNPAPVMPLVELVPTIHTSDNTLKLARELVQDWGKTAVVAKDTPGFIVNRIQRPFYGEALNIFEEGIADAATIDWAMKEIGGFRMGPFELMDFIGNDVNYTVTEAVFKGHYYDSRFRPSLIQKRLVDAGFLGRKTSRGFYDYHADAVTPEPHKNREAGIPIFERILSMLINEACECLYRDLATAIDIEVAMVKGANYPKGLLQWADEFGLEKTLSVLMQLQDEYGDDRYRPSALLKHMAKKNRQFYPKAPSVG